MDVDKMIAWENGELDLKEAAEFFQGLINSGMAWKLQGSYGRQATWFIEQGHCKLKGRTLNDG